MARTQPKHLQRTYELSGYKDATTFLELLARKKGRVLKGGEPDLDGVAKIVINDWIRGRLPWFTPPPHKEGGEGETEKGVEGRVGRLGEMGKKRKRDDVTDATESVAAITEGVSTAELSQDEAEGEDEFTGFSDDDDSGLELEVDGESERDVDENEEDSEVDAASDTSDEDDAAVDEDIAAISAALTNAKKRQRKN